MPLYRAQTHKLDTLTGERWANVYTLLCSTVTDAITTITAIQAMEATCSYTTVEFTGADAINKANKLDRRSIVYTGSFGELATTGLGGALPLFVTNLITFSDNVRKPEHKFMRFGAQRNNLELGVWSAEWIAFVDTNFANPLWGTLEYVGPTGERPTGYTVVVAPANRQLGWHRRTRPGYHRGWVPNA